MHRYVRASMWARVPTLPSKSPRTSRARRLSEPASVKRAVVRRSGREPWLVRVTMCRCTIADPAPCSDQVTVWWELSAPSGELMVRARVPVVMCSDATAEPMNEAPAPTPTTARPATVIASMRALVPLMLSLQSKAEPVLFHYDTR
jgi:hypothetical protein